MRLAYFEAQGRLSWGAIVGGNVQLLRGSILDWAPRFTHSNFQDMPPATGEVLPLATVRILPPVERGSKVIVIGANYRAHLKEFDLAADIAPVAFMKPRGALIGPGDNIRYSPLTKQLDFEVELVVVIGSPITLNSNPMLSILGYTIGNDVSQRDLQKGTPGIGMDFLGGKGLDKTSPVGPWIVTRDEFGDASPDLAMTLKVNGEIRQSGRSSEMTWDVGKLAEFIDSRTSLEPGDIIFTGTLPGVGRGDGRFLNDGDRVETIIEHLGAMSNIVRKPADEERTCSKQ